VAVDQIRCRPSRRITARRANRISAGSRRQDPIPSSSALLAFGRRTLPPPAARHARAEIRTSVETRDELARCAASTLGFPVVASTSHAIARRSTRWWRRPAHGTSW
jgi:hypothetical protein